MSQVGNLLQALAWEPLATLYISMHAAEKGRRRPKSTQRSHFWRLLQIRQLVQLAWSVGLWKKGAKGGGCDCQVSGQHCSALVKRPRQA